MRATATGLALIDRTVPFARQVTERTYGALNPGERVALQFLLRKMMEEKTATRDACRAREWHARLVRRLLAVRRPG